MLVGGAVCRDRKTSIETVFLGGAVRRGRKTPNETVFVGWAARRGRKTVRPAHNERKVEARDRMYIN